jgi:leucyl/phenylalanyl-tRNA--protein transferase
MVVIKFPNLETADRSGLLAVGGDLDPETLLLAYSQGIFPWPHSDDDELTWFSPPRRAVLYLDRVKIPRSLAKERKRGQFRFGINTNFEAVIDGCRSSERPGQSGTWITSEMRQAYVRFHRLGFAHSIECYAAADPNGAPVGGLYGVSIGQMFAGESMYFNVANASKMSLWFLIEQLKTLGVPWIDCQQLTPLLASFGAVTVRRAEFAAMVSEQSQKRVCLFPVTRDNNRYAF